MPTPIIPIVLGLVGLTFLTGKRGGSTSSNSSEAEKLFATIMTTGGKTDAALIEMYAQKIEKLGRPDLAAQLRNQLMLSTPEGKCLAIYTRAMTPPARTDVGLLEEAAQQIDVHGVRPDLAAALRAQKAALLAGIGK